MITVNTTKIEGDGNIIAQNITNSTIQINTTDRTELNNFLNELKILFQGDTINVFVLSSTIQRIRSLNLPQTFEAETYYKDEIQSWCPFGENTIIEILQDCVKYKLKGNRVNVYTMDSSHVLKDDKFWAYLQYIKNEAILIADVLSLQFDENKQIAKIFNDFHIGGCIVISNPLQENGEIIQKEVFNFLEIYLNDVQFNGRKCNEFLPPNTHLYIGDIHREVQLINVIASIASHSLGIKPKRGIDSTIADKFNVLKLDNLLIT